MSELNAKNSDLKLLRIISPLQIRAECFSQENIRATSLHKLFPTDLLVLIQIKLVEQLIQFSIHRLITNQILFIVSQNSLTEVEFLNI